MSAFLGTFGEDKMIPEIDNDEKNKHVFLSVQSQDLLGNACLLEQGRNQYILCSRIRPSHPNVPNGLCLYPLKSVLTPKLSTHFLPIMDTYTKACISKMNSHYFGTYQIKQQSAFLTLFKMSGKGFKKLATMKLNSTGIKTDKNALCFLETPYECLFIPGDGTLRYINLKKKVILDESACGPYEGVIYHSKLKMLAVKNREELQLMKLTPEKKIKRLEFKITGHETFKDQLSKPEVNFLITQYTDLKDYAFDEENSLLYVVFAWVSWTHKSVIFSLPPTITHLRFQKWKIDESDVFLEEQKDIEWHHSRTQTFCLHPKNKQCFVNGINELFVISLDTYNILNTISGKELFTVTENETVVVKEVRRP